MTPGTILFLSGIGVVLLAFVLSLVTAFTAKGKRRKIDAKMKAKY